MSDRFLTAAELHRLTGAVRYSAQRRALDRRRIRYVPAESGEPLVRLSALDRDAPKARASEPRLDLVNG